MVTMIERVDILDKLRTSFRLGITPSATFWNSLSESESHDSKPEGPGLRVADQLGWQLQGPLSEHYELQLRPIIDSCLRNYGKFIRKDKAWNGVVRGMMVGLCADEAVPAIVVTSSKEIYKRFRIALRRFQCFNESGFIIVQDLGPIRFTMSPLPPSQDNHFSGPASTERHTSDTMEIWNKLSGQVITNGRNQATLGAIVKIGEERLGLTVAHFLLPAESLEVSTHEGDMNEHPDIDEEDILKQLMEYESSSGHQPMSTDRDLAIEIEHQDIFIASESFDTKNSRKLGVFPGLLRVDSNESQGHQHKTWASQNKDWALILPQPSNVHPTELPSITTGGHNLVKLHLAERNNTELATEVELIIQNATGRRRLTTNHSTCFISPPWSQDFMEVSMCMPDPCFKCYEALGSESGCLAFEPENGAAHGMVIANSPESGITYISRLSEIFKDIEVRWKETVIFTELSLSMSPTRFQAGPRILEDAITEQSRCYKRLRELTDTIDEAKEKNIEPPIYALKELSLVEAEYKVVRLQVDFLKQNTLDSEGRIKSELQAAQIELLALKKNQLPGLGLDVSVSSTTSRSGELHSVSQTTNEKINRSDSIYKNQHDLARIERKHHHELQGMEKSQGPYQMLTFDTPKQSTRETSGPSGSTSSIGRKLMKDSSRGNEAGVSFQPKHPSDRQALAWPYSGSHLLTYHPSKNENPRGAWSTLLTELHSSLPNQETIELIPNETRFHQAFAEVCSNIRERSPQRLLAKFLRQHDQIITFVGVLDQSMGFEDSDSLGFLFWTVGFNTVKLALQDGKLFVDYLLELNEALPAFGAQLSLFPDVPQVQSPLQDIYRWYMECYLAMLAQLSSHPAVHTSSFRPLDDRISSAPAVFGDWKTKWEETIKDAQEEEKRRQITPRLSYPNGSGFSKMPFGAGEALGVVSLSLTLFHGCVQGLTLLSKARCYDRDISNIRLQIELEQHGLFTWAEAAGLTQEPPTLFMSANDAAFVPRILGQLKSLLSDLNQLKARSGLDLKPTSEEVETLDEDENTTLGKLGPKSEEYMKRINVAIFSKRKKPWKMLRWVTLDEKKIGKLLDEIKGYTARLEKFLKQPKQAIRTSDVNSVLRDVIINANDLEKLDIIGRNNDQLSSKIAIAAAARLKQTRLKLGFSDSSSSKSTLSLQNYSPDMTSGQRPSYNRGSSSRGSKNSHHAMRLSKKQLHMQPRAMFNYHRSLARYENDVVLLEWKVSKSHDPSLFESRVDQVALFLHDLEPCFHSLPCRGYVKDYFTNTYGYIFDLPEDFQSASSSMKNRLVQASQSMPGLRSLSELFDQLVLAPSLKERLSVSATLLETLLNLHTSGWLHQELRSDNIIFIRKVADMEDEPTGLSSFSMYVAGYIDACADGPGEMPEPLLSEPETDLYRHPLSLGSSRPSFRKSFDIFSVGCILLEIGLWSSLRQILEQHSIRPLPLRLLTEQEYSALKKYSTFTPTLSETTLVDRSKSHVGENDETEETDSGTVLDLMSLRHQALLSHLQNQGSSGTKTDSKVNASRPRDRCNILQSLEAATGHRYTSIVEEFLSIDTPSFSAEYVGINEHEYALDLEMKARETIQAIHDAI